MARSLGKRLKGRGAPDPLWWPRLLDKYGDIIPHHPGPSIVPFARVPDPPQLGNDQRKNVEIVHRWYKAAMNHHYKRVHRQMRGADKPEDMYAAVVLDKLVAFMGALQEKKIAPAAWFGFSISAWKRYGSKRGMVPLVFLFSTNRVREREGWFFDEESGFRGGRVIESQSAKRLTELYSSMKSALFAASELHTEEDHREKVSSIVKSYLPRAKYMMLVNRAKEEVEEIEHGLRKQLARGDWLW